MGTNQLVARRRFEVLAGIVAAVLGTALLLFAVFVTIKLVRQPPGHPVDVLGGILVLLAIVLGGLLFVSGLRVKVLLSLIVCALIVLAFWSIRTERARKAELAANWVLVDSTPTGRVEIDTKRIGRQGDLRSAWLRISATADAEVATADPDVETHRPVFAHAGDRVLILREYHCTSRTLRDWALIDRENYGVASVVGGTVSPPPFEAVPPARAFYEAALRYLCGSLYRGPAEVLAPPPPPTMDSSVKPRLEEMIFFPEDTDWACPPYTDAGGRPLSCPKR